MKKHYLILLLLAAFTAPQADAQDNIYYKIDRKGKKIERSEDEDYVAEKINQQNKLSLFKEGDKYGYIDKKGVKVVPAKYSWGKMFTNGFAEVQNNMMTGIIDETGKEIIPTIYDRVEIVKNGKTVYFEITKGDIRDPGSSRGITNTKGELLIPLGEDNFTIYSSSIDNIFLVESKSKKGYQLYELGKGLYGQRFEDFSGLFNEGLMCVKKKYRDNKYGFINTAGELVIPFKYSSGRFYGGVVNVSDEKLGSIALDKTGAIVARKYDKTLNTFEGLTQYSLNGLIGFIDVQGNYITQPEYNKVNDFKEGMAVVKKGNKYGALNTAGTLAVPLQYDDIANFSEGVAKVEVNKKCGYVDMQGKEIIPVECDVCGTFIDGLAPVQKQGKFGFINREGKTVIPFIYESATNFSEEVAFVKLNGLYGLINTSGMVLISPRFTEAKSFAEGLAAVKDGDSWGFIDHAGNVVLPFKYTAVRSFKPTGIAEVSFGEKYKTVQEMAMEEIQIEKAAQEAKYARLVPKVDPNVCTGCGGSGYESTGDIVCTSCHGKGSSSCSCSGGYNYNYKGESSYCSYCQGSGQRTCHSCMGYGTKGGYDKVCGTCKGTGQKIQKTK